MCYIKNSQHCISSFARRKTPRRTRALHSGKAGNFLKEVLRRKGLPREDGQPLFEVRNKSTPESSLSFKNIVNYLG